MVGHARRGAALPEILFVTVCGTRALGRSPPQLAHLQLASDPSPAGTPRRLTRTCAHEPKQLSETRKHASTERLAQGKRRQRGVGAPHVVVGLLQEEK